MRQEITTGLPSFGQPFAWAVAADNMIFTAQGPVTADGKILQGDIAAQTRLTLDNLKSTLAAGGASLDDVMQMQVYLTHLEDVTAMDAVYAEYFSAPYPNRCTLIVAGLVAPGMRIEVSVIVKKAVLF
jgi:enamine deaminase RidA (YjgF/YER057c/UK114 family)